MGKMRFKISIDDTIPFEVMMKIFVYLAENDWKLTFVDNGNIVCEKLEEFELKQEKVK